MNNSHSHNKNHSPKDHFQPPSPNHQPPSGHNPSFHHEGAHGNHHVHQEDTSHLGYNEHQAKASHLGHHDHHIEEFKKRFWISLVITFPVLLFSEMIQTWFGFRLEILFQKWILFLLSSSIYFYGGWPFLKGAVQEIRNRRPGMMTLIGTAISVAFFYSSATVVLISGKDFFWELATLIDVMLLGHWIEAKSVLGASRALEELVKIMPTTAHLYQEGESDKIVDVSVSQLKPGHVVLIRPGEKVPADGEIIEGESYLNEALLTGESRPVHKKAKDNVIGGAINGEGSLKVVIEKTGEETYLAQVIKLVQQAQESKSKTQDLANRAAALLFYLALGGGFVTYTVWLIAGKSDFALERAVTVLVIACPHALGLAIPLVVALSTSITAKYGTLIRDRRAFEAMKDINAVIFDKTGTLTEGKLGVTEVVAFIPEEELVRLSAGVEVNSEHIIAQAIVQYAQEKEIDFKPAEEFKALPGKGAVGHFDGRPIKVGGPNLLEELGVEINDERITNLQAKGKTVVFTLEDKKILGAFALSDRIRKESVEAVHQLKRKGIEVFMLTGDAEEVARSVAEELGIHHYFAHVLPDEKADKVKLLREKGYKVAMVGDGINDAPALVTAEVGIAIGAGTDVAIESADLILVKNDPREVAKVISISQKTYTKMLQNLWWAAGYNIIAIPLAAGVLSNLGVVINPAIGALLMSLSTVIVAINTQTLRKLSPKLGEVLPKAEVKRAMSQTHPHQGHHH
ncbi:MAG: heavy metal translocating P-type ATPase [Candidatus Aminicenantes bacterium]|nr:MAG: heavy metal translocating P-type ATPase [Candidatus Aminicenantes bacterium]